MVEIEKYSYVCFIDILGYRNHLDSDRTKGTLEFRTKLAASLLILDQVDPAKYTIQSISDSVILTCPKHEHFIEFLELIRTVFHKFLENGLLIRGGIAYSRHFQNKNMTYSHALALAYENESENAIYPRIVIDKDIIAMYSSSETLTPIAGKGLLCKMNDIVFLNIISKKSEWDFVFDKAKLIFMQDKAILMKNEVAFNKHLWFQEYIFALDYIKDGKERYIPGFKQI